MIHTLKCKVKGPLPKNYRLLHYKSTKANNPFNLLIMFEENFVFASAHWPFRIWHAKYCFTTTCPMVKFHKVSPKDTECCAKTSREHRLKDQRNHILGWDKMHRLNYSQIEDKKYNIN